MADRTEHGIFVATSLTALFTAINAAKKTVQGGAASIVGFTQEIMDLLAAMATGIGAVISKLDDILNALRTGAGTGAYPPNADTIIAQYVNCPQEQPNAYNLPNIPIPTGMALTLFARNPNGTNAGIIWVSNSQANAGNNLTATPMLPGMVKSFLVKNANALWIGAQVAGEGVYIDVEQNTGV